MDDRRYIGRKRWTCRVCDCSGEYETYNVVEMMNETYHEFEYFICSGCNCLQIGNIPDNLGDYYGKGYYSYEFKGSETAEFDTPVSSLTAVLDVGCGSGSWLYGWAQKGHSNLYGCDPFIDKDIIYGDRVHIYKKTIHELDGEEVYDLIRMSDSFEHVTDPHETLDSAYRLLKKGGILFITIPFFPNVAFEIFGAYWYQLDAPRHINIFSDKSLKYMCEKHGFEIVKIEYDSNNSQFIRSFLYQKGIPFNKHLQCFENYYSKESIKQLDVASEEANKNKIGDHVKIKLKKI